MLSLAHERLRTVLGDRDGENPADPSTVQAMPLVLRIPHDPVPDRRELLEAAATACVALCLDDRAGAEGDISTSAFASGLMNWYGARIRKVARRARNKKWRDVQSVPGVTVTVGSAEARAFVPCPVTETPPLINRLQIEGTDLPLPEDVEGVLADDRHPVIYVDASLGMTVGKAAAQVAHGSMLLAAEMDVDTAAAWSDAGFPLHVCEVDAERFREVRAEAEGKAAADPGTPQRYSAVVQDAGYTEVAPGSVTVVALQRG